MRISKAYIFAAVIIMVIAAISGCTEKKGQGETGDIRSTVVPTPTEVQKSAASQSVAMDVTAIAVRGGYPASDSKTYQYQIDFVVKNEGGSDIVFDTVGLYFRVDDRAQPLAFLYTGPEKKWTIKPGSTATIPTDSADRITGGVKLARSRGYDSLVLEAVFFNNGRYVNGVYGTLLPLVEDLPHESGGRGVPLKFLLTVPKGSEGEAIMVQLYEALPLPDNKMGKSVEVLPTQKKVEPTPEITSGQGSSEPRFAMIGFVTLDSSPMSSGLEYKIDLVIQSAADHPVTFNKIEVKYYDQSSPVPIVSSISSTTLEYGQAVKPSIKTYNLQEMQNRVENAGKKTIVIYIQLMNNGEKVGGEYSASLPPLSYMQTLGTSHEINFALDNDPLYARKTR